MRQPNVSIFRYTARSSDGETVAGVLRAESAGAAAIDLRRRSLFVTSLASGRQKRAIAFGENGGQHRRAMLAFFRALAVLVRAGVPLRRALDVTVAHCSERRLREALRAVKADVEQGSSLSAAFARRPSQFTALQSAMIGAGESGGVLDDVLERIAEVLEREHALRKKLEGALLYPAIVAASAVILILFLMVHVVPMFASLFARFAVPLPWPTKVLLGLGSSLAGVNVLPVLAFVAAVGMLLARSPRIGRFVSVDRLRLRTPLVGGVIRHAITARVARMLGLLLRSGVGVLAAIDVVAPVSGSRTFGLALAQVGEGLRRGEGMLRALQSTALFDPLTLALVGVGEESGALDAMLIAAANYLDVEVESAIAALVSLVEPVLIGVLGLVVGLIVFSIFLPLYGLIGSIS